MSQTKADSIAEVSLNTGVGAVGSFLITLLCIKLIQNQIGAAVASVIICTIWSIARGYYIRRYFDKRGSHESH